MDEQQTLDGYLDEKRRAWHCNWWRTEGRWQRLLLPIANLHGEMTLRWKRNRRGEAVSADA